MAYPTNTDPAGSIPPQSDAVEGPPGTWTGGTTDSAAVVITPLINSVLDIMGYLGLSGDAANPAGNITQLVKALTLWAASSTASVASASTLTLPTTGAFITVTGTTQINDLALPVAPLTTRLVILRASSDGLVIKNLNHQKLGADVTLNTDQTLVLFCTGSFWYPLGAVSGAGLTNPMSAQDDVIVGGTSGTPARLAKGSDGQVLTVDPTTHHVIWANSASGFANPMTSQDDVIVGGTAGTATRLAKGSDGQVLTVDPTTHHLVWATPGGLTNPMTTDDDVIIGGTAGAPARLGKGGDGQVLTVDPATHHIVWANSASGFANPMVAQDDLIIGGTAGTGTRLAKGADAQVLTVDPSTHHLIWRTIPSFGVGVDGLVTGPGSIVAGQFLASDGSWATPGGGGFSNPMTTAGDLIKGGVAGAAGRLAIGSSGDVLTVVSGAPAWAAAGGGGGNLFGQLSPFVPPVATDFPTWINQGSATLTATADGLYLFNAIETANHIRARGIAYSGAKTLTVGFLPFLRGNPNPAIGLCITDGTTGTAKAVCMEYLQSSGAPRLAIEYWNAIDNSSVNSTPLVEVLMMRGPVMWFQIVDDGTHLAFNGSSDGQNWLPFVDNINRTGFLTPAYIGFFVNPFGSAQAVGIKVLHWSLV